MNPYEPQPVARWDTSELLGMLPPFPDPTLVGFTIDDDGVDVDVAPIPDDDRSCSAGVFAFTAPPTWSAVGMILRGAAVQLDSGRCLDPGAHGTAVLTRAGELASRVVVDGLTMDQPAAGIAVDAMHRILGLASPGSAPPTTEIVTSLWMDAILTHVLDSGSISWSEAAALHPSVSGPTRINPSIEMLTEATIRAAAPLSWERLRLRAACRDVSTAELHPSEAAWMDSTMFARWALSYMCDVDLVLRSLDSMGATDAAVGISEVVAMIARHNDASNSGRNLRWSA